MQKILQLFSILQLTKEQLLTGFTPGGIKSYELPSLAEHHYTCGMMAMILGGKIKKVNQNFDSNKLLKMLLTHDLGELFGGDVSAPLNRKYSDLKEHKDKIGERAIELITSYLDDDNDLKEIFVEMNTKANDEAIVCKIIDQIDHQFYLEHINYNTKYEHENFDWRKTFVSNHIYKLTERIENIETKKVMDEFLENFEKDMYGKGYQAMNFLMKD
ncbi:MAG: HD domain-containing protein [Candidatus Magasanikbacteria bacterium]